MFGLCLALMLSPTTQAQSADPGKPKPRAAKQQPRRTAQQRLQNLEKKIFQAARYIEGLHREIQLLKRSAGLTTPPVAAPPPSGAAPGTPTPSSPEAPQAPAPPPGRQHAFKGRAPESPAEQAARERRRREAARMEQEESVSQEQETPDLQASFLRQANAVLIPRGRFEIEPSLSFRYTSVNNLRVRGVDLIENIFIGTIEVQKLKRSVFTHSYSMRYGLHDRFQLNLSIPYQRAQRQITLDPEVQRDFAESVEEETEDGGIGDITAGLSIHLLREGEWLPDVIMTTSLKSDTGTSPFEVDSGSLATGTGFWGLRTGFTMVKVSDPAVMFLSAGYFSHWSSDDVEGFREVDPPDSIDVGFGMSYALNPFLSITTRFSSSFSKKTKINGQAIDGSDNITSALGLGVTYALSGKRSLDISAEFGLTDESPDFTVRVSMPISVALPPFWEEWRSWRLSRIFRF